MAGLIDTNVLVYCRDASEPEKQVRAAAWMAALWEKRAGRLSYQVLQEFYVTVTAKLDPGMDKELARRDVRALLAWQPLRVDARLLEGAWLLQDRFKFLGIAFPPGAIKGCYLQGQVQVALQVADEQQQVSSLESKVATRYLLLQLLAQLFPSGYTAAGVGHGAPIQVE